MKKFLLLFFLCLVSLVSYASGSLAYGYASTGDEMTKFTKKATGDYYAYITLTADDATRYAGATISKVSVYVPVPSSKPSVVIYIKDDYKSSSYLMKQASNITVGQWTTITLNTPYTITAGKPLYIGYAYTKASNTDCPIGGQANKVLADSRGDIYGFQATGASSVTWGHLKDEGLGNVGVIAELEGVEFPEDDISIVSASVPSVVDFGQEISLSGLVRNNGANAVSSYEVAYRLNGGAEQVKQFACNLASGDSHRFDITIPGIDYAGKVTVDVEARKPNGNDDVDPSNNSWNGSFTCADLVPRTMLLEQFTGQDCPNCPSSHDRLKTAIYGRDVVWVCHHSYKDDQFKTYDDSQFTWLFNSTLVYAPAMSVDRTFLGNAVSAVNSGSQPAYGPASTVPDKYGLNDVFDYCAQVPTTIKVDLDTKYDSDTRKLNVKFLATSTADVTEQLYVNVWIVEDNLVAYQSIGNSVIEPQYVHNNVYREALSYRWGDEATWVGRNCTANYSCTLNSNYDADNVKLVAFISRLGLKDGVLDDPNASEVLNTTSCGLNHTSGVNTVADDANNVKVTATQGGIEVTGFDGVAEVYGIDGSLKASAHGNEAIALPSGFYVVKAGSAVKKVAVK